VGGARIRGRGPEDTVPDIAWVRALLAGLTPRERDACVDVVGMTTTDAARHSMTPVAVRVAWHRARRLRRDTGWAAHCHDPDARVSRGGRGQQHLAHLGLRLGRAPAGRSKKTTTTWRGQPDGRRPAACRVPDSDSTVIERVPTRVIDERQS
jgi:hypothetical protein